MEPQRIARIAGSGDRGRPTERIQTRRPGHPGAVRDVGDTARRVGQQPAQRPTGSAIRDRGPQIGLRVGPPGMRGRPVAGGLTDPDGQRSAGVPRPGRVRGAVDRPTDPITLLVVAVGDGAAVLQRDRPQVGVQPVGQRPGPPRPGRRGEVPVAVIAVGRDGRGADGVGGGPVIGVIRRGHRLVIGGVHRHRRRAVPVAVIAIGRRRRRRRAGRPRCRPADPGDLPGRVIGVDRRRAGRPTLCGDRGRVPRRTQRHRLREESRPAGRGVGQPRQPAGRIIGPGARRPAGPTGRGQLPGRVIAVTDRRGRPGGGQTGPGQPRIGPPGVGLGPPAGQGPPGQPAVAVPGVADLDRPAGDPGGPPGRVVADRRGRRAVTDLGGPPGLIVGPGDVWAGVAVVDFRLPVEGVVAVGGATRRGGDGVDVAVGGVGVARDPARRCGRRRDPARLVVGVGVGLPRRGRQRLELAGLVVGVLGDRAGRAGDLVDVPDGVVTVDRGAALRIDNLRDLVRGVVQSRRRMGERIGDLGAVPGHVIGERGRERRRGRPRRVPPRIDHRCRVAVRVVGVRRRGTAAGLGPQQLPGPVVGGGDAHPAAGAGLGPANLVVAGRGRHPGGVGDGGDPPGPVVGGVGHRTGRVGHRHRQPHRVVARRGRHVTVRLGGVDGAGLGEPSRRVVGVERRGAAPGLRVDPGDVPRRRGAARQLPGQVVHRRGDRTVGGGQGHLSARRVVGVARHPGVRIGLGEPVPGAVIGVGAHPGVRSGHRQHPAEGVVGVGRLVPQRVRAGQDVPDRVVGVGRGERRWRPTGDGATRVGLAEPVVRRVVGVGRDGAARRGLRDQVTDRVVGVRRRAAQRVAARRDLTPPGVSQRRDTTVGGGRRHQPTLTVVGGGGHLPDRVGVARHMVGGVVGPPLLRWARIVDRTRQRPAHQIATGVVLAVTQLLTGAVLLRRLIRRVVVDVVRPAVRIHLGGQHVAGIDVGVHNPVRVGDGRGLARLVPGERGDPARRVGLAGDPPGRRVVRRARRRRPGRVDNPAQMAGGRVVGVGRGLTVHPDDRGQPGGGTRGGVAVTHTVTIRTGHSGDAAGRRTAGPPRHRDRLTDGVGERTQCPAGVRQRDPTALLVDRSDQTAGVIEPQFLVGVITHRPATAGPGGHRRGDPRIVRGVTAVAVPGELALTPGTLPENRGRPVTGNDRGVEPERPPHPIGTVGGVQTVVGPPPVQPGTDAGQRQVLEGLHQTTGRGVHRIRREPGVDHAAAVPAGTSPGTAQRLRVRAAVAGERHRPQEQRPTRVGARRDQPMTAGIVPGFVVRPVADRGSTDIEGMETPRIVDAEPVDTMPVAVRREVGVRGGPVRQLFPEMIVEEHVVRTRRTRPFNGLLPGRPPDRIPVGVVRQRPALITAVRRTIRRPVRIRHRDLVELEQIVPFITAMQIEIGIEAVTDRDVPRRTPLEREVPQITRRVPGVDRIPHPGTPQIAVTALTLVPRTVELVVDDTEVRRGLGRDRMRTRHLATDTGDPAVRRPLEHDPVHRTGRVHVAVVVLRLRRVQTRLVLSERQILDTHPEHGVDQRIDDRVENLPVDGIGPVRHRRDRNVVLQRLVQRNRLSERVTGGDQENLLAHVQVLQIERRRQRLHRVVEVQAVRGHHVHQAADLQIVEGCVGGQIHHRVALPAREPGVTGLAPQLEPTHPVVVDGALVEVLTIRRRRGVLRRVLRGDRPALHPEQPTARPQPAAVRGPVAHRVDVPPRPIRGDRVIPGGAVGLVDQMGTGLRIRPRTADDQIVRVQMNLMRDVQRAGGQLQQAFLRVRTRRGTIRLDRIDRRLNTGRVVLTVVGNHPVGAGQNAGRQTARRFRSDVGIPRQHRPATETRLRPVIHPGHRTPPIIRRHPQVTQRRRRLLIHRLRWRPVRVHHREVRHHELRRRRVHIPPRLEFVHPLRDRRRDRPLIRRRRILTRIRIIDQPGHLTGNRRIRPHIRGERCRQRRTVERHTIHFQERIRHRPGDRRHTRRHNNRHDQAGDDAEEPRPRPEPKPPARPDSKHPSRRGEYRTQRSRNAGHDVSSLKTRTCTDPRLTDRTGQQRSPTRQHGVTCTLR